MGLTIYANNEPISFDMGGGGFFDLRLNICKIFDKELGEVYSEIPLAFGIHNEINKRINEILSDDRFSDDDEDIVDFLFASDCEGKISHKTCKKIYDLIKDIDFGNSYFQYINRRKPEGDYEAFKRFLKNCYSNHRKMRWC